jgi:nicotinate-nucleotide--dimethylbenzimidazole phosphoribosyltransferase
MNILDQAICSISGRDQAVYRQAEDLIQTLSPSQQGLGRLLDVSKELSAIQQTLTPCVARKKIVVMAGDHGIAAHGVSKYPQDVTVQMVRAMTNGVSGSAVLARQAGAELHAVDVGVNADLSEFTLRTLHHRKIAWGTNDFLHGPAMTREQAIQGLETGISIAYELADSTDLFATGDKGIGNTTPSSAVVATLCDVPVAGVTGRGTGLDDEQLQHKISVLEKALEVNRPDSRDPIDVLSKVGGYDIAGIAGLILGAAAQKKAIVIDGFISTAGALIAARLAPLSRDYMIAAHMSVEQGHRIALADLEKEPLLDLAFRLGEGTGAAMAMNLIQAAASILTEAPKVVTNDLAKVA